MDDADIPEFIEQLKKAFEEGREDDAPPYIFTGEEVLWLQRLIPFASTPETFMHLKRSIVIAETLTDEQIDFLPEMVKGAMFKKRLGKFGMWVLVGMGIILTNMERIWNFAKSIGKAVVNGLGLS